MLLQHGPAHAAQQPVIAGQGYLLGHPKERPVGLNTHSAILDQHTTHTAPVRDNLNELYGNA
jgi:hypothetical protein